ncbi:MAG: DUF4902 domain-containing protein [Gammaproteobacteria bacterium]|nr:DUF4902 domain-containing protein [Gammaproteobacteria bacterium]
MMNEASDGYVRIPRSALSRIYLEHVTSAIDPSVATPDLAATQSDAMAGYTEWCGRWREIEFSVGWDWALVSGVIVVLAPATIRTNVLLLMESGFAAPPMLTRVYLLEWMETQPWRETIVKLLP